MPTVIIPDSCSGTDVEELPRRLLKQRAYDVIKQQIQENELAAGTFLSERQLASQLGMSKTPVKAALERLESEGFVAVSPQQGIVVLDVSVHEIADQFEIRLALETFVLRSVAGRLNTDQVRRIRENLDAQQLAADNENISAAVELDAEFHALFCEFMGNLEIVRVMARLRERIHRVIMHVFRQDVSRLKVSLEEHKSIAAAVLHGDSELAAKCIEEHLQYGKQQLLSPRKR